MHRASDKAPRPASRKTPASESPNPAFRQSLCQSLVFKIQRNKDEVLAARRSRRAPASTASTPASPENPPRRPAAPETDCDRRTCRARPQAPRIASRRCATASASRSSAYRLRAAMNPRKSRPDRVHRALHQSRIALADQPHRNGVIQHRRLVDQLVRGAANRHAQSSLAGPARLHEIQV